LYINDILIARNIKPEVQNVKNELNNEFEMKDLGAAGRILWIEFKGFVLVSEDLSQNNS